MDKLMRKKHSFILAILLLLVGTLFLGFMIHEQRAYNQRLDALLPYINEELALFIYLC